MGPSRGMDRDTTRAIIPTPMWVWDCAKNPWSPLGDAPGPGHPSQCHTSPRSCFLTSTPTLLTPHTWWAHLSHTRLRPERKRTSHWLGRTCSAEANHDSHGSTEIYSPGFETSRPWGVPRSQNTLALTRSETASCSTQICDRNLSRSLPGTGG